MEGAFVVLRSKWDSGPMDVPTSIEDLSLMDLNGPDG